MPSDTMETEKKANGSHHDDESSKTRTRVSRACTRCRTRKDRCDGQRPSCSACLNAHQVCCYEPSTKKRGLPEGYVRGLEKLLALLIGKVDGFEEKATQLLRDNRLELGRLWNHVTVGEDLHTMWKESKVLTELENLLSTVEQASASAGQKRKRERDEEGAVAEAEPDLNFHLQPIYSITRPGHDTASGRQQIEHANPIQTRPSLPRQTLQILDYYFAHTHCWFPILHRSNLTRACYELSRNSARDAARNQEPLLWAILAYTLSQLRSAGDAHLAAEFIELPLVHELRMSCTGLLPSDTEMNNVVHAQTLLILSLLEIGNGRWKPAWNFVGKAVRIVLGIISEQGGNEVTTATLQGATVLDTAVALHLRCVPHLRQADMRTAARLFEDGREEWEPWNAPGGVRSTQDPSFSISCFNRLTDVLLSLSDVFRLDQTLFRPDKEHAQTVLAALHQLQLTFPGSTPPTDQSPPHQVYLQICHTAAQMRIVDLPVEIGVGPTERLKLAGNILSLLTLCQTSDSLNLAFLPPFLADSLDCALRLARSSASAKIPNVSNELPALHDFEAAVVRLRHDLASVWPVYSQTSKQPDTAIPTFEHTLAPASSMKTILFGQPHEGQRSAGHAIGAMQNEWLPLGVSSLQSPMGISDSDPAANSFTNAKIIANSMDTSTSGLGLQHPNGVPSSLPFDRLPNSFDLDMMPARLSSRIDPALMEASPSFDGDEIDAIFHEMAHLDTNEWTSERATGLKDFGFADDLTFQAFCNDPDRVIESLADGQQTLSSSIQTWMFTNDTLQPP